MTGERKEWIKPIMFSGGIGSIDSNFIEKDKPKPGMIVTKIGGPVYRIGVGGGAASSVEIQGILSRSHPLFCSVVCFLHPCYYYGVIVVASFVVGTTDSSIN